MKEQTTHSQDTVVMLKLSVKNVRIQQALSEETRCFSATLYVNNTRCATVTNRGQGGPNNYYPVDDHGRELLAEARAWVEEQPEVTEELGEIPFTYKRDLDCFVTDLLNEHERRQWLKRQTRTKTLFRLPDDPDGEWRTVNAPYSERVVAWINGKYANAEIINPAEL